MTPEEEALGYFTYKKLKNLENWDEWKKGEKKQIDQFTIKGMFCNQIDIPQNIIIVQLNWQYAVKKKIRCKMISNML